MASLLRGSFSKSQVFRRKSESQEKVLSTTQRLFTTWNPCPFFSVVGRIGWRRIRHFCRKGIKSDPATDSTHYLFFDDFEIHLVRLFQSPDPIPKPSADIAPVDPYFPQSSRAFGEIFREDPHQALAVALRPRRLLSLRASASTTFRHTPILLHSFKKPYTVLQWPNSLGGILHWQQVLFA